MADQKLADEIREAVREGIREAMEGFSQMHIQYANQLRINDYRVLNDELGATNDRITKLQERLKQKFERIDSKLRENGDG